MTTRLSAAALELLRDPITLDTLTLPVLASDGYTYSLSALQDAMASDDWHRSPVTGEILRQQVFPNAFIAALLGEMPIQCDIPLKIFSRSCPVPVDAFFVSFTCAESLNASDAAIRREWALPSTAIHLRICARKDSGTGTLVCAHPPCAAAAIPALQRLLQLFGIAHGALSAPTHISSAILSFKTSTLASETTCRVSVEEAWLAAFCSTPSTR